MPLGGKDTPDGESENSQVKIVTQANNNEECYSEELFETAVCHICSVEVPVTCYKEHTESEGHVTLEKIFQNMLERLSKQIKITIIHNENSLKKDLLYHCVSCSKIIKIEHKQKHEMSYYHIRSQKQLSTVKEFYKILKNENPIKSSDIKEVESKEIVDKENALSQENISEKLRHEEDVYKAKENRQQDNKDYKGGLNIPELRLDNHMSDKNDVENTKEVYAVQKVVSCELCNVNVAQDQIEYHNAGTPHWSNAVKKIFTSVSRGLEAYLSEDEPKPNDTSEKPKDENKNNNTYNHKIVTEHKDNEAKGDENASQNETAINNASPITEGKNTITNVGNTIISIDGNTIAIYGNTIAIYGNTVTKDGNTIAKDENTTTKVQNTIENGNLISTSISNGYLPLQTPFRFADSSKTKVTCIVCDQDMDNTQKSVDSHTNTSKHRMFVKDLYEFHSIVKKSNQYLKFDLNEVVFCESCNISVTDIWKHIKTKKHTALLQLEIVMSKESFKNFVYKCKGRYSKASTYREYYKMMLKTNKVVKSSNMFCCELCKLELSEEGSEIDHMFSQEHEKQLAKMFNVAIST